MAYLIALLSLFISCYGQTITIDRIVAIVNDQIILQSELNVKVQTAQNNLSDSQYIPREELQKKILNQMIIHALQTQYAKLIDLSVSPSIIQNALSELANRNGKSVEEFVAMMAQKGIAADTLRQEIENELLISQLQEIFILRKIEVTAKEIEQFLLANAESQLFTPDYFIEHFIAYEESFSTLTREEIQEYMKKIHLYLEKNDQIAQEFHDQLLKKGIKLEGNIIGWKKSSHLPEIFVQAIESMQKGHVSAAIPTSNGYHFLKLLNIRGDTKLENTEVHTQRILVQNTPHNPTEAEKKARYIYQKILSQETSFLDMARTFSDDSRSSKKGGQLGWIPIKALPLAIQEILNDNQEYPLLTDPIETELGWEIYQISDKKSPKEMNLVTKKEQARNFLVRSKFDQKKQEWLLQLKNNSHIEILL